MCILLSSEAQASSATEAKLLTNEDGMIETIKHSKLWGQPNVYCVMVEKKKPTNHCGI